jgi:hypothetical protein
MRLNMLWARLIRRRLILVIIVVFAAIAGYAGWYSTHGEAQSHTSVLVVPPTNLADASAPNPVLNLTDRTTALASALVVALHTDQTANYVAAGGATAYTATNIRDNLRSPEPGSLIQFEATGPDESTAHAGAQRLIDQTTQILTKMQIDAAVGQQTDMAHLQVIVPPEETMSIIAKQRIRAAAAFAVATFLAGVLLYGGVDAILDRRRSRARDLAGTDSLGRGDEAPEQRGLDPVPSNGHANGELAGHHSERSSWRM